MIKLTLSLLLASSTVFAAEPTFEQVRDLVTKPGVATVDQALSKMKQQWPTYFDSYVLAYKSLSLQGSSYLNPRAIVFGQTANYVISFNGHPGQKAYSNLEMVSFDPAKGYSFREIRFLKEPGSESSVDETEIETRTENVAISRANPGVCLQCHSQPKPHPIWATYSNWPGMYGSNDDDVYRIQVSREYAADILGHQERGMKGTFDLYNDNPELAQYKKFLTSKNAPGSRYRFLADRPKAPYADFTSPAYAKQLAKDGDNVGAMFSHRPNLALLERFTEQQAKLILHDVLNGEHPSKRLLFLANAVCRTPDWMDPSAAEQFNDQELRDAFIARFTGDKTENHKDVVTKTAENLPLVVAETQKRDLPSLIAHDAQIWLAGLGDPSDAQLGLALHLLGLDLTNYALNLYRLNDYDTGNAVGNFSALQRETVAALARNPETRADAARFQQCLNQEP